jgi:4-hydroxy-4-methyl-2-oxoglutarate aldolase
MSVVVTDTPRPDPAALQRLGAFGVATIHEAQGRCGLMQSYMRPIYPRARLVGSAITVSVPPADNWMIHVAVEQCREGDVLVVAPTSPSDAGYFGELLATSLRSKGVVGLIIEAGVRDVGPLTEMRFPVWSRYVWAQGTVKETLGDVNVPLVIAGQLVHPGDAIVADDDGVVVVPRQAVASIADKSAARETKEAETRKRLAAGELGVDIYGMREKLAKAGLAYKKWPG